jgi:hypothetical protein
MVRSRPPKGQLATEVQPTGVAVESTTAGRQGRLYSAGSPVGILLRQTLRGLGDRIKRSAIGCFVEGHDEPADIVQST